MSTMGACSRQPLAKGKGVHREVESEGSRRQTLAPRNTNHIRHIRWDEFARQNEVQRLHGHRNVNAAGTGGESYQPYRGRSHGHAETEYEAWSEKVYHEKSAKQKQILISLVADFDPYQAGDLAVDPDIETKQFIHKNGWNIGGMGWLANEIEQGIDKDDVHTNTGSSTDHSIFVFFNDIGKLEEGTYTWDGDKWVKQ